MTPAQLVWYDQRMVASRTSTPLPYVYVPPILFTPQPQPPQPRPLPPAQPINDSVFAQKYLGAIPHYSSQPTPPSPSLNYPAQPFVSSVPVVPLSSYKSPDTSNNNTTLKSTDIPGIPWKQPETKTVNFGLMDKGSQGEIWSKGNFEKGVEGALRELASPDTMVSLIRNPTVSTIVGSAVVGCVKGINEKDND